jgi:spore germination protein KB
VVASYLGGGIFQFPRELATFGGPDAGWSYLLLTAGYFALIYVFLKIAAIDPTHSFGRVTSDLLTPVLGLPIRWFRIVVHLLLAVVVVANFGQVLRTYFLMGTPQWALEGALVATALYTAWYGTAVLGRTLETGFVPTLLASLLIGLLVIGRMRFAWAILPTWHVALEPTLLGAYHSAYIFIGFEMVVQLYRHVRYDERQAAVRWALGLYTATAGFFAFGFVLVMGTEGPDALVQAQWPPVSALRLANLRGFFINKLGLLVVVVWGLFTMGFVAVRFWCLSHDLTETSDGRVTPLYYHLALVGTALTTLLISQLLSNVVVLVHLFQVWGLPIIVGYLVLMPILILPAAWLRRRVKPRLAGSRAD